MTSNGEPPGADGGQAEPPPADLARRNVRLGALVVAVLVGVLGISLVRRPPSDGPPSLSAALRASLEQDGCTLDTRSDPGRAHTPAATYTVDPPAGGDHDSVPSKAGFYEPGNVPADGHLVHSLEHGFVIVWYKPEGVTPATVDRLRELARLRWVLVVPRPSLPTALAATAWRTRLLCPDGAEEPIATFVTALRNRGPEKGFV
jgi:Protein of unknown function (DUF3105)